MREFYIAGTRYRDLCEQGTYPECVLKLDLIQNEALLLERETNNEHDPNVVLILKDSVNKEKIGYVPAYYAKAVSEAISHQQKITCKVKEFSRENCQECVKVVLTIAKKL